ncbi:MAG: hypothetical protein LKI39_09310 [Bacteroides sp.]|jgi:hypothetical protein|nr:hypothetical protein [Bacteroides sp.]MCI1682740.1 hypothetical protein [Bacteroides sp.]
MKGNNHSSPLGDKHLKSLLFLCARSAKDHNKEILLYFIRKYQIEKKPYYLVMNNVANKLLRILYRLIHKEELYDRDYIQTDPRSNQEIREEEKAKLAITPVMKLTSHSFFPVNSDQVEDYSNHQANYIEYPKVSYLT